MLERLHFEDRESWIAGRQHGFGGSDAAAAVGLSPWMTPLDLWKIKIGASEQNDLSDNSAVQTGVKWEPVLRELYKHTHEEYIVEHHPYDILYQSERPWLFATLDGEMVERETGRKGVLEIKTATPNGKAGWEKWANGSMPQNYYVQVLHQLLATGYDFVRLFACLFSMDGSYTIKEHEIERDDAKEDMEWLFGKESELWEKVQSGTMPALPLIL